MVSKETNSTNNQRTINPISRETKPKVSIDKIAPKSMDKVLPKLWSVQVLSLSGDNTTGLDAYKRRIESMGYKTYRVESDRWKKLLVGPFESEAATKTIREKLRVNGYLDAFLSSQEKTQAQTDQMAPEDQKVITFSVKLNPAVDLTNGGVTIIHQGSTSDESDAEMAALINATRQIRNRDRSKIALFTPEKTMQLSALFAPSNPLITVEDELQLWILNPSVFTRSSKGPVTLQRLLRQLYKNNTNGVPQAVFVANPRSAPGFLLAELVHDLGIQVRYFDDQNRVLAEVHRPDSTIATVLLGDIFIPNGQAKQGILAINQQKDRAETQNDIKKIRLIETKEQELLARLIEKTHGEKKTTNAIQRAPYLQRLILSAYDGKKERDGKSKARQIFYNELTNREFPLAFNAFRDPNQAPVYVFITAEEVKLLAGI